MTSTPTEVERAKERSLIATKLADTVLVATFIIAAITTGSLTMLSETLRGSLLLVIGWYSVWMMRRVHRGRMAHYEFGVGKHEQFVWVVVGVGMLVAAFWVMQQVYAAIVVGEPPASPLGLTLAAVINGVNLLINAIGLAAMQRAAKGQQTGIFGAQITARRAATVASVILQVTLTGAALAKDPGLALIFDAVGALLIVYFKLRRGVAMIRHGLPDLLDAPAEESVKARIRRAAEAVIPASSVKLRTRRSGDVVYAEVNVPGRAFGSIAELARHTDQLADVLKDEGAHVDIVIVAEAGQDGDGSDAAKREEKP